MLDNPLFVICFLSLTFLPFLVIGWFSFKILKIDKFLPSNMAVNIPIFGAAGFVISLLFLNFVGVFTIGIFSSVLFFILTALASFFLVRSRNVTSAFTRIRNLVTLPFRRTRSMVSSSGLLKDIVPLFLIIFTFLHFSFVISVMGWPPVGDILSLHGPATSILLWNGKIISTLEPVSSLPLYYPIGFHVLAANIALWFHLFPGEAVFLLGGLSIILIPLLLYSLTYTLTKSMPLSILVYFSMFIIHPSGELSRWVVGYFYNGPYPNLTAFMMVILSIYVLGLIEYRQPEKLKQYYLMGFITLLFFSSMALLLVYPSFTVFIAIMTIFVIVKYHDELVTSLQKKTVSTVTPFFLVGGFTLLALPKSFIYSTTTLSRLIFTPSGQFQYGVSQTFLFDHITGYAMWVALFISLILIYRKKYLFINLIYVIIFCMVLFTLSPVAPVALYLILPARAVIIPWTTSWLILSFGITEISELIKLKTHFYFFRNSVFMVIFIAFVILTPQFTASIIQEFSLLKAQEAAWYTHSSSFQADFIALLWVYYNIPPDDLILNDQSWTGYWILSLSVKNITYTRFMDSNQIKRGEELEIIWNKPYERDTVNQLLKEYNVSYIFVTSEWSYYRDPKLGGGIHGYIAKPFSPEEYTTIFDTYPFLKIVFRLGSTTIYKVNITSAS